MVALRMVMLISLSKLWSTFCRKCLYKGDLVFVLMSVLCSVSLLRGVSYELVAFCAFGAF